jgi:hypothetical protein
MNQKEYNEYMRKNPDGLNGHSFEIQDQKITTHSVSNSIAISDINGIVRDIRTETHGVQITEIHGSGYTEEGATTITEGYLRTVTESHRIEQRNAFGSIVKGKEISDSQTTGHIETTITGEGADDPEAWEQINGALVDDLRSAYEIKNSPISNVDPSNPMLFIPELKNVTTGYETPAEEENTSHTVAGKTIQDIY